VGSVDKIVFRNSIVGTSFSETVVGDVSAEKSTIKGMMFSGGKVKNLTLTDCGQFRNLGMYQATVGSVSVNRCSLNDFRLPETKIENLRIENGTIANSKFEGMKVKSMILSNVTLDGELNFTNAHADKLETHNITKQPGLNLITTGSNIRLE
jgi:hypothetical protein